MASQSRRGFEYMGVAAMLLLAAGCLGSTHTSAPGGPPETPFNGGSLRLNLTDFGWLDVAIPAVASMTRDDFAARITFEFATADQTPTAMLHYIGLPFEGRDGGSPSETGLCVYGHIERSMGKTCGKVPTWSDGVDGSTVASYYRDAGKFHIVAPVLHYFLTIVEAKPGSPAVFAALWRNTTANVTYGPSRDSFVLRPSTFSGPAGGERVASLVLPQGRSIVFNMHLSPTMDTPGATHPWYERPNGTKETLQFADVHEVSGQAGTWRFHLPAGTPPDADDVPEVWGAFFDRAKVP